MMTSSLFVCLKSFFCGYTFFATITNTERVNPIKTDYVADCVILTYDEC